MTARARSSTALWREAWKYLVRSGPGRTICSIGALALLVGCGGGNGDGGTAAASQPSVAENARLAAQLWVTINDATLACFESKYRYNFWRPTSAINLADTDGNADTDVDPAWTPFVATPNHPEYPAAHGCVMGALAEMLKRYFGTREVQFALDSTVSGTTHTYRATDDLPAEVTLARIWGGMHFRTSVEHGIALGQSAADWVADHHFQPNGQ